MDVKVPVLPESQGAIKVAGLYVNDGQYVKKYTVLFCLETDKVALDIESTCDGIVCDFQATLGDVVCVNQVMMTVREPEPNEQAVPDKMSLEDEVEFLKQELATLKQQNSQLVNQLTGIE